MLHRDGFNAWTSKHRKIITLLDSQLHVHYIYSLLFKERMLSSWLVPWTPKLRGGVLNQSKESYSPFGIDTSLLHCTLLIPRYWNAESGTRGLCSELNFLFLEVSQVLVFHFNLWDIFQKKYMFALYQTKTIEENQCIILIFGQYLKKLF